MWMTVEDKFWGINFPQSCILNAKWDPKQEMPSDILDVLSSRVPLDSFPGNLGRPKDSCVCVLELSSADSLRRGCRVEGDSFKNECSGSPVALSWLERGFLSQGKRMLDKPSMFTQV